MHSAKHHETRAAWRRDMAERSLIPPERAHHLAKAQHHADKAWAINFLHVPRRGD